MKLPNKQYFPNEGSARAACVGSTKEHLNSLNGADICNTNREQDFNLLNTSNLQILAD